MPSPVKLVLVALAISVMGCAPVKIYERGRLSSPSMTRSKHLVGYRDAYRSKVVESKTGGGLAGTAPGGGCGCTQ